LLTTSCQSHTSEAAAVAAARHSDVGDSMSAARQCREREARRRQTARRRQRGGSSAEAAAVAAARHRDVGNSMSAAWQCREREARRWQTARWWQRGGSSAEAAAVAAARHRDVGGSMLAARQCQQRQQMWRQCESWQWRAMAAAQSEEHRGCGGFTSTIHKCANARAFGRPEAPMYWNVETYWWLVGCGSITLWLHKSCHMTTRDFTRTTPTCVGIHTCMWVQLLSPKLEDNTISV